MSYATTTGYTYTSQKPIIDYSRSSSIESRDSYRSSSETFDNRSPTYYTSTSTMANGDYKKDRSEKRRVPDNARHYMTTTTSTNGNKIHNHEARRYDAQEPRSSEAYQYQNQQRREDREYYPRR
ncbi:uncharacterized protein PAC_06084 [Phialocephala subalpina]|uniref:Uncharacterized protein n=1 Tax=Phialocephala subalpina TaxID=576137 RepID=A0A1L7WTV5_9HELO|nr:uncharacterized protein PAC_06084 [Phialocephala subalpina]